jgi:hypothetical protein
MKLEEICTSLEMSKQLQEAGFKADTCFWWLRDMDKFILTFDDYEWENTFVYSPDGMVKAYNFEQLWKALPSLIIYNTGSLGDRNCYFKINNLNNDIDLVSVNGIHWKAFNGIKIADACAECLIWCIENDFISLD